MSDDIGTNHLESLSAGFFGKLPEFSDFIKYNASGKEILVLDNWIQEGLALAKIKYKNEWKIYYNNCSKIYFIYPYSGTDKITLGIIYPANDKSGRSYPFIMFVNISKSIVNGLQCYFIPLAFEQMYNSFNNIVDSNNSTEDLTNLKALTTSVKIKSLNISSLSDEYSRFTMEKHLGDIIDFKGESSIRLTDLFLDRINILEHLCVINFMLNSNEQKDFHLIGFYIEFMQRLFKETESMPGIFWVHRNNHSGFLILSFTKPSPKDFIDLVFYESFIDIEQKDRSYHITEPHKSLNSIFRNNAFVDNSISLNDFLNSIQNYIY